MREFKNLEQSKANKFKEDTINSIADELIQKHLQLLHTDKTTCWQ